MPAIRRILVAIKDTSARSLPAVQKAAQLARAHNAQLELYHAISEPIYVDALAIAGQTVAQLRRKWRDAHLKKLDRIAERLREAGTKVTTRVDWDFPAFEAVVRRAQWQPGSTGGEGHGVGLAFARYKNIGNYAAVIAEVELTERVRVKRVVAAVDCGCIVNPDGVLNQLEGGIVQVTSWVLKEQVQFDEHQITSTDWDHYPILRFSELPRIDIELISRPEEPSLGVGEGVTGPTAAAIGNAVYNALGVRVRDLPLQFDRIVQAMS